MVNSSRNKFYLTLKFFAFCIICFFPLVIGKIEFTKNLLYVDEALLCLLASLCLFKIRMFVCREVLLLLGIIAIYILYSLLQVLILHLPLSNMLQVAFYLKMPLVFMFFYLHDDEEKSYYLQCISRLFDVVFVSSLIIAIPQYLFPQAMGSLSHDGRGLNGVCLMGIFYSRTHFAQFLIIYFLFKGSVVFRRQPNVGSFIGFSFLILLLISLTFSRKELFIFLIMQTLIWYYLAKAKGFRKIWFLTQVPIYLFTLAVFFLFYRDINQHTFSPNQIRFVLYEYAHMAYLKYFPLGSGPGTFGSILSLNYTELYQELGVSKWLYGDVENRGPIFDIFLFSLIVEMGIGFLAYLGFIFSMVSLPCLPLNEQTNVRSIDFRSLRIGLIFSVLMFSLFVPVYLTLIGFLVAAILACISTITPVRNQSL